MYGKSIGKEGREGREGKTGREDGVPAGHTATRRGRKLICMPRKASVVIEKDENGFYA